MEISQHIEINPKIMMGKPVIKGTRITVESLLEKLPFWGNSRRYFTFSSSHYNREHKSCAWLCSPIFEG